MAYTLQELTHRMGLSVPPVKDELARWSYKKQEKQGERSGFAEVYLSQDGGILTVDIQNTGCADALYAQSCVKQLYMQAERERNGNNYIVTHLEVDGYKDFDLTDGITAEFGLSVIFGTMVDMQQLAAKESIRSLSDNPARKAMRHVGHEFASNRSAFEVSHREGNVVFLNSYKCAS